MKDDMRKIGVVICNYNKRDYVLNCIASMLKQSVEADIYVVDNASADGSAEAVRQKYGQQVTLIENKDNLGGSGGFNTGLRRVLQEDYTYIMLMDNDVVADVDAVKHFWRSILMWAWQALKFITWMIRTRYGDMEPISILKNMCKRINTKIGRTVLRYRRSATVSMLLPVR